MTVQIDHALEEIRRFRPSPEFAAQAVADERLYEEAAADRLGFWADQARSLLTWEKPFTQTLDWSNPPFAKWFADGELNIAVNCLDRHVEAGLGDRIAVHWEGEPGDSRSISYAELTDEVKRAANTLEGLGVKQGDRVAIYLPMIPEAVVSMLAVARLGAIHSVVFGGFSADSLASRIDDAEASVVITADGGYRKGRVFPLKPVVDDALAKSEGGTVRNVLVVKRGENEIAWNDERDLWWHETVATASAEHEARSFDAENPLFILYTSGTTGKPKGILHTSGGYLTQAAFTHKNVFDLHPERDVYWCTADVGWITGHSYVVYGPPLANGATQVLYEARPTRRTPDAGGDRREVRRHDPLHGAHRDPLVHEARPADPARVRPAHAPPPRVGRRAHQPRGVDLVPPRHRRRLDPGRRHVVADRDGRDHDLGASRRHRPEARFGAGRGPGHLGRHPRRRGNHVEGEGGGLLTITEPWPSMLRGIWATPSGSEKPTGRSSATNTSRATARVATRTATSGCSAGSTTS